MPGSTKNLGLPYPLGNEVADPALDIKNLAESLDGKVETPTGAQSKVDALSGAGNTKTVKALDDEVIAHKAEFATYQTTVANLLQAARVRSFLGV